MSVTYEKDRIEVGIQLKTNNATSERDSRVAERRLYFKLIKDLMVCDNCTTEELQERAVAKWASR